MRTVRFFCEFIEHLSSLDPVESNHLSRVLRLREGASVELFDGNGTHAQGIVHSIDRKQVVIQTTHITRTDARTSGRIILLVSFAKGQRFDWLIEKCTELGADHIAAVQFEHSVKLGKESAMERYRKIAIAACKQCGRIFLPAITGPTPLQETVNLIKCEYPANIFGYGDLHGVSFDKHFRDSGGKDMIFVIGPEGGFSNTEKDFLESHQAAAVTINRNILRTETAAVGFCALSASFRIS